MSSDMTCYCCLLKPFFIPWIVKTYSFGWIRYFDKFQGGDSGSDFLRVEGSLTGESFASSYGYEMATLDINGDKWVCRFFKLSLGDFVLLI